MREIIGYARVSTRDQNLESQIDELTKAGCTRIFADHASGARSSRPEWDKALSCLRKGDVLVVTRLDRAGRSMSHLMGVLDELLERGVELRVLQQGIDTTTSGGRLFFHILGSVAEFEHDLIVERVRSGLAAARARGNTGGRPRALPKSAAKQVREMYDSREYTVLEIAEMFSVSPATVYRVLRKDLGDSLTRRDIKRIHELATKDKWSVEQIASDMGLSMGLVSRALNLEPLGLRP